MNHLSFFGAFICFLFLNPFGENPGFAMLLQFSSVVSLFIFFLFRFAIVEELAGFGATIHTCSRNQKELDEKIQEWKGKGFKVTGSVCDLYIREEREQLIQTVSSVLEGKLDILVSLLANYFFFSTEIVN